MPSGPRNAITDVIGLRVGNAEDHRLKSGVSVVVCDEPAVAGFQVLGGAPGTRETDLLEPHNTVQGVDAIVLSGGSAFGLDAASGAQSALAEMGRGFAVGPARVPIVPAAILFDLLNGGEKSWGRYPPYRDLGYRAVLDATLDFSIGSRGAGTGALTAGLKGGLGTASSVDGDITIGALVAVNALGSTTIGNGQHFWASPFEEGDEFGALGMPLPFPADGRAIRTKMGGEPAEMRNTTIAVIATDATLTKAEAKRLAISAHDGFARAIWPAHTPFDGDIVFTLATGKSGVRPDERSFVTMCALAASTMARAIARGVYSATPSQNDLLPTWSRKHEAR